MGRRTWLFLSLFLLYNAAYTHAATEPTKKENGGLVSIIVVMEDHSDIFLRTALRALEDIWVKHKPMEVVVVIGATDYEKRDALLAAISSRKIVKERFLKRISHE